MSRFRGQIERRIFKAVLLVLGACERPMEAQPPTQPVTELPPPTGAAIAVAPLVDAPLVDAPVAVVPVDAAVVVTGRGGDAKALCANHKKRSRIDRKQARQGKPPMEGTPINDSAFWDSKNGVAVCTIVHERARGSVVVTRSAMIC